MTKPKSTDAPPLRHGLDALAKFVGTVPEGARPSATPPASAPSTPYTRAKKLVVRREKKGHGGKTVTRIEGLGANDREREALLPELKRALGCGARVEGDAILLQGELRDRVVALLRDRGATNVVAGN